MVCLWNGGSILTGPQADGQWDALHRKRLIPAKWNRGFCGVHMVCQEILDVELVRCGRQIIANA